MKIFLIFICVFSFNILAEDDLSEAEKALKIAQDKVNELKNKKIEEEKNDRLKSKEYAFSQLSGEWQGYPKRVIIYKDKIMFVDKDSSICYRVYIELSPRSMEKDLNMKPGEIVCTSTDGSSMFLILSIGQNEIKISKLQPKTIPAKGLERESEENYQKTSYLATGRSVFNAMDFNKKD